ncbi:hypothetical protein ARMGADRAFT_1086709 [Armillaria gallica]|uniref:JmjC domain-containing protein n=1 Tax=Armillaria gallica TaxID=47427 RepID=A0A2H3DAY5_ARMGA|nr:hypothetical protein ARMGADRAFT_1086709 [Armillaria gallica]
MVGRQDSYIDEYMGDWAPGFIPDLKDWTAEVVLLEPGSAFYMHPDTHHAVVTLENSIVKGHLFYCTVTLLKTVLGWVHMYVLLCMMCYFGVIMGANSPKKTQAMIDWTHMVDFDLSDNEEEEDSDDKDCHSRDFKDPDSSNRDSDNKKNLTTTSLLKKVAMHWTEEDTNSQIGSELMSKRDPKDEDYRL